MAHCAAHSCQHANSIKEFVPNGAASVSSLAASVDIGTFIAGTEHFVGQAGTAAASGIAVGLYGNHSQVTNNLCSTSHGEFLSAIYDYLLPGMTLKICKFCNAL